MTAAHTRAQHHERIRSIRRRVWRFYRSHRRDLPFRRTRNPYRIAVAEIMLQQTQVERVIPKYEAWVQRWPSWQALAKADRRDILARWSGLGYNRRALYLHRMANEIVTTYRGRFPRLPDILEQLPGIGRYTARAILIFAFNEPLIAVDTNIRRVLLHEFNLPATTSPAQIEDLATRLAPRGRSRDWHNALMDYSRLQLPQRIKGLPVSNRQSRFQGSRRQIRGEIIRRLTSQKSVSIIVVAKTLHRTVHDVIEAARTLEKEGTVTVVSGRIALK